MARARAGRRGGLTRVQPRLPARPRSAARGVLAEALGGPTAFTSVHGDEASVVRMHACNGEHREMDERAVACFAQALDDVGYAEPLRTVLHDYFSWVTHTRLPSYSAVSADDVAGDLAVPRWSWDGLQA